MTRLAGSLAILLCMSLQAHESRPAYLSMEERAPNTYQIFFKQPLALGYRLSLKFHESCVESESSSATTIDSFMQRYLLACSDPLNQTELKVDGLRGSLTDLIIRIVQGDHETVAVVKPSDPSYRFDFASGVGVAEYFRIGVEHLLFGWDHLTFLLCLILLLRPTFDLLKVVTAFTVAHSFTLSLAALGLLNIPVAPLEILIAASVVIAAIEAARSRARQIALKRIWYFVLVFGLLHGAGFASALSQIGLPEERKLPALFLFNLGIEFAQILIVTVALLIGTFGDFMLKRLPSGLNLVPVVATGGFAFYWFISRSLDMLDLSRFVL